MLKVRAIALIGTFLLLISILPGGLTIFATEDGSEAKQATVEAKFIECGPGDQEEILSHPKVTTIEGVAASIYLVKDHYFPDGQRSEDVEATLQNSSNKVYPGLVLDVTPRLVEGGVRLVGRATITDVLDIVETIPANADAGFSYSIREVVVPFSVVVPLGGEFLQIPMAMRGDRKLDFYLRAELAH